MKRVVDLDLGPSPIDDPDSYPGRTPTDSYLLIGDRIAELRPVPLRRLEAWRVENLAEIDTQWRAAASDRPLSYGLLRSNSAPVHRRIPVVAVGSNASPPQLVRKLAGQPCSSVLPAVKAGVRGIGLAFSAHISRRGYLPAAPVATADPDTTTPVWVTLLDTDQAAVMDETELNYELVVIGHPDGGWILELPSGERLDRCAIYRSRHGTLAIPACEAPGRLITQSAARAELVHRVPTLPSDLADWQRLGAELAPADSERGKGPSRSITAITDVANAGLVLPDDGLGSFTGPGETTNECRYGDIASTLEQVSPTAVAAGGRGVLASGRIDRRGQPCITLDRSLPENRGFRNGHAFVRFRSPKQGDAPVTTDERSRLGLLCRVVDDPRIPPEHAGIDQIVRDALGVARRETVWVTPSKPPGPLSRLLDFMPRRYVVCRAQIADLHLVEQRACALTPATFDLLGIGSGDEVVLEGTPDPTGRLTEVRIKAVPTPDSMFEERVRLSGGGLDSRYPSARDALGVHPDLPWVFIDQDVREALGLSRLGAVRVRASRRYQARKETRELLLLILLAGIGVVTVVESPFWRWLSLALLGLVAVGGSLWRLADRLR